jgi:hypothetical protein
VEIANDNRKLAESLAAGEVRLAKTRVTLVDRVFGALAEGHFNGGRLTAGELAAKAGTNGDGARASIALLRLLGFRINVTMRTIQGEGPVQAVEPQYEYWFASKDEKDIQVVSDKDLRWADLMELASTGLSLLSHELDEKAMAKETQK